MTTLRKSCHGCADLEKEVFAVAGGKTVYKCRRFGRTLSNSGALGIWLKEEEPGCWSAPDDEYDAAKDSWNNYHTALGAMRCRRKGIEE